MRRRHTLSLLAVAMLLMWPREAQACSCMGSAPPCQAAWGSPVIFAGTVIELDQLPGASGPRRVRFRITEAFRGTDSGEIDIHLNGGGGPSCDPEFRMGQSWLVYAGNRLDRPGWTASSCSRTTLLDNAAEDLAYLRLPDEKKGTSRIIGRVMHHREVHTPVPNVQIRVTNSDGDIVETVTAADGNYSVELSSHQVYEVRFGSVPGMIVRGDQTVWILHHRACVAVDGYASDDGRVAGVIVDARNRPVPFLPISLKQLRSPLEGGMTYDGLSNETGRFEFRGLPPASYTLRASERLWRDAEAVALESAFSTMTLGPAERIDVGRAALPESARLVLVEGVVEDQGKPIAGAELTIKRPGTHESVSDGVVTDARGLFRISLIDGKRYEFEAWSLRRDAKGSVALRAVETVQVRDGATVHLRLAPFR